MVSFSCSLVTRPPRTLAPFSTTVIYSNHQILAQKLDNSSMFQPGVLILHKYLNLRESLLVLHGFCRLFLGSAAVIAWTSHHLIPIVLK